MKTFPLALACAGLLVLGLAGCHGGAQTTGIGVAEDAAVGVQRNLSAGEIAALKDTCGLARGALTVATAARAPATVRNVAVYPAAFCKQIVTGQTANADQHSTAWLDRTLIYVADAAKIAGYILPLILPSL